MKRILSFICLLSFGVSPILSLTTAVRPTTAQTYSTSAFCRDHQQIYAFTQWTKLLGQLDSDALTPSDISQLLNLLRTSGKTPQTIQLTIDRLTLVRDLQKPPLLLNLIERTPTQQRSQFIPVIDELVTLAAALPPGYNYAQSRALITSAQAYTQLNQPLRSTPILLQANRTLAGITVPTLKAETQWRLAEAWFGMGQKLTGQANLAATTATLSTLSPRSSPLNNNLPTVLVDSYLGLGQWSEAEAAARAIPIFTQQTEQLFRIATAYQKAGQVQPASTLFNQTINSILRSTRNQAPNQKDLIEIATDGMISFAQAGGIITAAEAAKQLPDNQPALRAKAWLAIAGEARQQNRPQEAAFALEQLIAAGKIGQQQGFGSGFGRLRDREWSGVLYALSRSEDYIPEMLQFIEELNLETEAAEFLIAEAVQSQRFEEAQQLIPRPMPLVIDVGVFEVEDSWDWWVASVAAAEGKPEQLIALSQEILSQIGTTEPEELSAWRIPTSPDITYPSSDRPPLFLPDIRPAESLPEERAIYAIKLLQDQGETKLAEKLSKALAEQAEDLLKSKSNVKLYADQHPIQWVHHLERYLRLQQQTKIADRLYRRQVKYLKRIKDSEQRAELIPFVSSLDDPKGAIADFIELAEAVDVEDQTQFAQRVFEQAAFSSQIDIMNQWGSRAELSPREQVQFMLKEIWKMQYGRDLDQEIFWYDQILELMQDQPEQGLLSNSNQLNSIIEGYLLKGQMDKAQQVISLLDDSSEARRQQQRISCLTD